MDAMTLIITILSFFIATISSLSLIAIVLYVCFYSNTKIKK